MTRSLAGVVAVVLLAACDDFDKDLAQYCTVHPDQCVDSGSGGGAGGGSGGCGDFGAACSKEGDCCATTTINGTPYPLGCGRINYCEVVAPDCRAKGETCSDAGQCCSASCRGGRCDDCFAENTPCTSAYNCCQGAVCGNDGACHAAGLGSGPVGGSCKSSSDCNLGWCEKDGGAAGFCQDPTTHTCKGLQAMTPPMCCAGLSPSADGCCQSLGEWCNSGFDCCSGSCTGGRCAPDSTASLGGRCDNSAECKGIDFCDPVGQACTDRWCFRSAATPYAGCCVFSSTGTVCQFPDGGSCILPGGQSATAGKCCSGQFDTDGISCSAVVIFD
jgi:hypothetical protein